jgi:murein DD-endopeptidase MepM/ murein hydrolase activator NlpD
LLLDVTDDVITGSVTRTLNAMSTAEFTLQNKFGKYTDPNKIRIEPMDRVIINMSRIGTPMIAFSGYVDESPYFQLYPGPVTVRASCTLKILQHTYFDPTLPSVTKIFERNGWQYNAQTGQLTIMTTPQGGLGGPGTFGNMDYWGGMGDVLNQILVEIGKWPTDGIDIKDLPASLYADIAKKMAGDAQATQERLEGFEKQLKKLLAVTPASEIGGGVADPDSSSDDPIPMTGNVGAEQTVRFAYAAGFRGLSDLSIALAVARAESALKADAINDKNTDGSIDLGLWQVNTIHKPEEMEYIDWRRIQWDPRQNAKWAYKVFAGSGWDAWVTYKRGLHVKYMGWAQNVVKRVTEGKSIPKGATLKSETVSSSRRKTSSSSSGGGSSKGFLFPLATGSQYGVVWPPSEGGSYHNWRGTRYHEGCDIPAKTGTPALASVSGTVVHAGNAGGGAGNTVSIRGTDGRFYTYMHLNNINVMQGQVVSQGTVVGGVGMTGGTSSGPHLHFEINTQGPFDGDINPTAALDAAFKSPGRVGTVPGYAGGSSGGTVDPGQLNDILTSGAYDTSPENIAAIARQAGWFIYQFQTSDFLMGQFLTGEVALSNDISLMNWITELVPASGRVFTSKPNGEFLAFYPDYFGWFERTPYFQISDIEIVDLTITKNDRNLATHVFATGPLSGATERNALFERINATVASVQEEAFKSFINIDPSDPLYGGNDGFDSVAFLQKYGARPYLYDMPQVPDVVLRWMGAWMEFTKLWANTYQANATFTFMPEILPGGLVAFDDKIQMFVNSVTHTFDMSGGFSTSAELMCPTALDADLVGLPNPGFPNDNPELNRES